ncbi:unnamed protein product [Protopolystoma xenopodis]|uniref:Uncharacterized protein n=1 Tax=Protopolystoma xenopodis TaxID=117903 RepID=A0A3S5B3T5_9PLAT|nr:unnamed protein product [Protopolystoma xenopodis]
MHVSCLIRSLIEPSLLADNHQFDLPERAFSLAVQAAKLLEKLITYVASRRLYGWEPICNQDDSLRDCLSRKVGFQGCFQSRITSLLKLPLVTVCKVCVNFSAINFLRLGIAKCHPVQFRTCLGLSGASNQIQDRLQSVKRRNKLNGILPASVTRFEARWRESDGLTTFIIINGNMFKAVVVLMQKAANELSIVP